MGNITAFVVLLRIQDEARRFQMDAQTTNLWV